MNNSLAKLLLLMPTHSTSQFSCGIVSLDTYLLEKALQNHKKQGARTYVVADCVIGYFTLGYGSVSSVSSALAPGQKNYLPLMFLTRLAVDKNEQGKGLGKALLKHALLKSLRAAEVAGLLAVVVHAKDKPARQFYQKFGFVPTPFNEFYLYLLIKDISNNLKN